MKRLLGLALFLVGCGSTRASPYDPPRKPERDTIEAESLSRKGADMLESDPEAAEDLLRKALAADIFCGPAHNNLGVIHLQRGDFYEAAQEFEWARKLMPGNPDPRVNLAITLDRAGQGTEAVAAYEAALAVAPEYLPAIQGLMALGQRLGNEDERREERLRLIQSRSPDEMWRRWAEGQLLRPSQ